MKILLLGGTGAMGTHLSRILSKNGDKVIVTTRSCHKSNDLIEYRQGNAKDLDFLKSILKEQWDAIIDFMLYSEEEFGERLDLLLSYTAQYIFLSSARVYNESQESLTEQSPRLLDSSIDDYFLTTSEYSLLKARQENMLFSAKKKNWTIIRPYITYSECRLQLGNLEKEDWLYRALKGRTIIFSKDIINHFTTMTYGFDVASGIASIIKNPIAFGKIYHITNENACRWSNILEIYLDVLEEKLGYRPKVIYQDLSDFLVWNPEKYQIVYDRLFDRKFDNSKIGRFVDIKEFVNVEAGLRKCLCEFLIKPEFKRIDWKKEAIKDRIAKEKTPLKEVDGIKQKLKYIFFRYLVNVK